MAIETLRTIHEESINQSTRVASCEISLSNYFEESGAYGDAIVTALEGAATAGALRETRRPAIRPECSPFLELVRVVSNAGIQETLDLSNGTEKLLGLQQRAHPLSVTITRSPSVGKLR